MGNELSMNKRGRPDNNVKLSSKKQDLSKQQGIDFRKSNSRKSSRLSSKNRLSSHENYLDTIDKAFTSETIFKKNLAELQYIESEIENVIQDLHAIFYDKKTHQSDLGKISLLQNTAKYLRNKLKSAKETNKEYIIRKLQTGSSKTEEDPANNSDESDLINSKFYVNPTKSKEKPQKNASETIVFSNNCKELSLSKENLKNILVKCAEISQDISVIISNGSVGLEELKKLSMSIEKINNENQNILTQISKKMVTRSETYNVKDNSVLESVTFKNGKGEIVKEETKTDAGADANKKEIYNESQNSYKNTNTEEDSPEYANILRQSNEKNLIIDTIVNEKYEERRSKLLSNKPKRQSLGNVSRKSLHLDLKRQDEIEYKSESPDSQNINNNKNIAQPNAELVKNNTNNHQQKSPENTDRNKQILSETNFDFLNQRNPINRVSQQSGINTSDELEKIENSLTICAENISKFIGGKTSTKYNELDENLVEIAKRLDGLNITEKHPSYQIKEAIMKHIYKNSNILEHVSLDYDYLESVEKEVQFVDQEIRKSLLSNKFENFKHIYQDIEDMIYEINEKRVNSVLMPKKDKVLEILNNYKMKIYQFTK